MVFKQGKVNLIVGPTGCGKTSLLMALLGELHYVPSGPDSWFNLPREGGVAYAAQESWVQNETIRENILFGSEFDEIRYRKVIHQCGLSKDLTLFEAGDKTEVGEKGLTLSGGQKARVTLARAVYSQAQILILDDILAALDVHTAKWIIEKCLQGDLVRGRTVLLVVSTSILARDSSTQRGARPTMLPWRDLLRTLSFPSDKTAGFCAKGVFRRPSSQIRRFSRMSRPRKRKSQRQMKLSTTFFRKSLKEKEAS